MGRTTRGFPASIQISIPIRAFSAAGLREGDVVQVTAQGRGRVAIARMDDLIDEYAGCLSTGGELGRTVRGLRQEWERRSYAPTATGRRSRGSAAG